MAATTRGTGRKRRATPRVENRALPDLVGLRCESKAALEWKAKQLGYSSAQEWIRDFMGSEFASALTEYAEVRELEALATAS
ncbi:hypothetical protein MTY66_63310 (plasmid) [Mycolicibacterium sp. TY66]|jgi:hypothetical protein|uniref:Uncharacterized protein n=1 Tax=Mycobacteroides chelonae TaxID=1774 RepID=A0A1S1LKR0_MYCCH|nr:MULTISPECIES: hypothetical protein [Mycobacteriaceae]OHU57042.1 hypothetical protein BKG82_12670 [Mycobacteroides chelonae]BCI84706.1 hypothetical protein MTY66_63310 [Mycolicibacterium sp. TY66]BCJ84935.1 hypothetical protein MTY81_63080 [Mycolicibacterium sp. TY81]